MAHLPPNDGTFEHWVWPMTGQLVHQLRCLTGSRQQYQLQWKFKDHAPTLRRRAITGGAPNTFLVSVRQRNRTRLQRFEVDQAALRPLPGFPLDFTDESMVRVSRLSLICELNDQYSAAAKLKVHIRSESVALSYIKISL